MKPQTFDDLCAIRIGQCLKTLKEKGEEYASNEDRLHNFKAAAGYGETYPEEALWGMLRKHLVSVHDIIVQAGQGVVPTKELWTQKGGDVINYILLLEGLLEDRRADIAGSKPVANKSWDVDLTCGEELAGLAQ